MPKKAAAKKPVKGKPPRMSKPKASDKPAAPTVTKVLAQLKSMRNEKMHAHNVKYGAGENQFGVKLGDIRTLANQIKTNHAFALELWQTGNVDAQLLATLLMKPSELTAVEMERLVCCVTFVPVADWLHSYVLKEHPDKESLRVMWMKSKDVMAARAAWRLTAGRVARSPEGIDLAALLDRIEKEMGGAASEVQWTMNACLAEIGIHFPNLRARALAIGEKLGIYRDYPVSKGCTSPFAPIWIQEMVRRQG